jgi:hypothetical protein
MFRRRRLPYHTLIKFTDQNRSLSEVYGLTAAERVTSPAVILTQNEQHYFLFEEDQHQDLRITRDVSSRGSLDPVDIMQQLRQPAIELDAILCEALTH